MITYSTNWMGPINTNWLEKNGNQWSGGRIDVDGVPDEPWGFEIGLPVMKTKDWNEFSDWLIDFTSEELLTLDELLVEYGKPISWFGEEK